MDNQSGQLPPIQPAAVPILQPSSVGGYQPMPQRAPAISAPVGRPSSDPEVQAQRVERTHLAKRLEGVTPNRAKDAKLYVFRTDGNGRARGRHVLALLAKEIEDHVQSTPEESRDEAIDELVTRKIPENEPDGIYKCQWYDKQNRPLQDPPPWEIDLGGESETTPMNEDDEPVDDGDDASTMPVQTTFPQPLPPPAPALDVSAISAAARQERQDAERRGNETMTMMMGFQNSFVQMIATMQQQQQQHALQAEERERARRADFKTTLLAVIPLVMPLLTQFFQRDKKEGLSPEMTALLDLMKANMNNRSSPEAVMENMMKIQTEMTKNQLSLQAQGASSAVQMQAEASALVFKNVMNTLKETMEAKPAAADSGGGTMDLIAKIAGPIIAQAMANQQQPPPTVAQPVPQAAPAQRIVRRVPAEKVAPPVNEQPERRVVRRSRPEAPAAEAPQRVTDPAKYTSEQRTLGCLRAVAGLSRGKPAPKERWEVVEWLVRWLPDDVLAAVKAEDQEQVLALAMTPVMADANLLQWVTDEENRGFLTDVLKDVRLLVLGGVTPEIKEASIIKGGQFVQRRRAAAQAQDEAGRAAMQRHNNPSEGGAPKPVVEASVVPMGGDNIAPSATPAPADASDAGTNGATAKEEGAAKPPQKPVSGKLPPPTA